MLSKDKLVADPSSIPDGDSVLAYLRDGSGNAISSTSGALHVNVQNASIAVTATDLDIRDLSFATDKVDVSGSSNVAVTDGGGSLTVDGTVAATQSGSWTVAVSSVAGTVAVTQSTSPWVVSATDLDIRDLAFATDSVTAYQGGSWSATVSATDLDIRDLSHSQDSVKIGDGTDFLAINNDGSINVVGSFSINGQYAEDSAHASGDVGLYNLAVRADAPAVATSADGDYASQTVDAYNRSWVNTGANVAITNGAASVTTSSALLVAAAAGRRRILVQNLGTKEIYIGASGVSSANGIRLGANGSSAELEIGPALALHAVAGSGTQDVRWLQLA